MSDWTATRRLVLASLGVTIASPALTARRVVTVIAGTYVREGGKGLYPITYDPALDHWWVDAPIVGIDDASFGIGVEPGRARYLVRETAEGDVSAYSPGWVRHHTAPTGGADPCHAAVDWKSGCLAVANYSSGSVAFYRLDKRTGIPAAPEIFDHVGSGPDRDRQASPHAHWVGFSPDGRWLHAVDLGADAIFAYRFDPHARTLAPSVTAWHSPAGAGPRHLIWHPQRRLAYVVCELSNMLMTLDVRPDGLFSTRHSVSTRPEGMLGRSQAAHISIDRAGRRLYVSNRGDDSVAVFALDAGGMPSLIQHIASGGVWPRMFLLLEDHRRLIVGNERSGRMAVFRILNDGRLASTGQQVTVPGIAFLGAFA